MMGFRTYTFDHIYKLADNVRNENLKNPDEIPVNIDNIIEFVFGIEIRPVLRLRSENDIEGFLSKDLKTIFIDNEIFENPKFENRVRFTLAHELGHLILHKDFYKETSFESPDEWVEIRNGLNPADLTWYETHANEFAGRLLVPQNKLESLVEDLKDDLKDLENEARKRFSEQGELTAWKQSWLANKLAPRFKVSAKTIEIRLKRDHINF